MSRSPSRNLRLARLAAAVGVGAGHLALFFLLGRLQPEHDSPDIMRPIEVELVRPSPAPPPVVTPRPEPEPAKAAGGGAPAAPSVVRTPPLKRPHPAEIMAPPTPAPEPSLIVGAAAASDPTPGLGQGGQGTGTGGGGVGSGSGPGAGDGPPRLLQGPTQGQLRDLHPREAFRRRMGGRATLVCRVRLDTRLEACRVTEESPPGLGFGQAALAASAHFRFRPPTRDGRPVAGAEVTVGVDFGP